MQSITGINGTMELYDDRIVLKRGKMFGNFERTIYLCEVIDVQIKKPGLTRAALAIATASVKIPVNLAAADANALLLKNKQVDEAESFKRAVEEAAARVKSSGSAPSAADEIAKFKSLLDSGAISAEEYELKKKELLGL